MTGSRTPNFLVVGAAKAGTTSLAHYLGQHPGVFMAFEKESTFWLFEGRVPTFTGPGDDVFTRDVITDRDRYAAIFTGASGATAVGEASVYYLHRPEVFARIDAALPGVRVIAVLRDPIERAFSAYAHLVRDGREQATSFADALAREDERAAAGWEWCWSYREAGLMAERIHALRSVFGDRALLLRNDELDRDPVATLARAYAFLGVDPTFVPDVSMRLNRSGAARSAAVQRFVTAPGRLKQLLAPIVPTSVKHRLWHHVVSANTRPLELTPMDRRALDGAYDDDLRDLAAQTGWDLSSWPSWPGSSFVEREGAA